MFTREGYAAFFTLPIHNFWLYLGTDAVAALAASGSSTESISLTAPVTVGIHHYGACVDAVTGESDTEVDPEIRTGC